ncbi:MAG: DNA polymerase III subunit beta [Brevundimonas sp.]|uniref:DNA polymerase III subunit beta n=1 Tax=Brevundimonas sp. TaxID=1871086 RepID=UPI0012225BC5|nr:DNA polymerase III subunit beta [Brevundimonas sp.]RZJ19093.1 MAG: DNA polymerase III subunit beta [Brevundimonas sp.]
MRLTVEQSALQRAAARVAGVADRKGAIPILANLMLDAQGDQLWIIATDLDIEIREFIPAEVETPGSITVSAATLSEIARNAPAGAELSIRYGQGDNDPRAQVQFGRSRYQLPVLPAGDFPIWGDLHGTETTVQIQAPDLKRVLDRVHFAQSTEGARYYLNGVYIAPRATPDGVRLRGVATDGHRLALDECPLPEGSDLTPVLASRKTIGEMRRLLDGLTTPVELTTSSAGLRLQTPTTRLTAKALDGSFPDYQRVVPRKWERQITLDRVMLAAAVKRVSLISAEKSRSVKFTIDGETLTLTVRNAEAGQAVEEIAIDDGGGHLEAGYNGKYLLDALDQTDAKRVVLRVTDGGSPARLDPHPDDQAAASGALCVIMPLRV